MSEAAFQRQFDAAFFGAWGGAMGGLAAQYTPAAGGPAVAVEVLRDTNVDQFGDDGTPISFHAVVLAFRREQIEPETGATVEVDGQTYTLVERIGGDASLSRWAVRQ